MYLGNQPALSYTSFAKQDFTTSATTSYTLDQPVANANELALFINFVRQEPTTAYTASGTTLTLTSATSATDDMYCVFLGKAVQTVNPPAGSVGASQIADGSIALAKLSATGTKDATTFLRGDNTFASAGGANTPAFSARLNSAQSISNNTETKVTCSLETLDTDNAYDNSTNYRFTPQTAGHYLITGGFRVSSYQAGRVVSWIRKNGSQDHAVNEHYGDVSGATQSALSTKIIEFNGTTDYVELYVYQNSGSTKNLQGDHASFFGGFKLIT